MRILIVGGGVAGLTLAALLRQRGMRPAIIERSRNYNQAGYVLGLWPLGSRVLHGLGLHDQFLSVSQPMFTYNVCNGHGEVLHSYSFADFDQRYGTSRGLMRSELLDILLHGLRDLPIRMGTSLVSVEQDEHQVRVATTDGKQDAYDLVVGCDGIHSQVRQLVFGEHPLHRTGWAGYAFWVEPEAAPHDAITEIWGAGRFFGIYPTTSRLCVFNGMPIPTGHREPAEGRVARMREAFGMLGGAAPRILAAVAEDDEVFYTEYADIRMPTWHEGRVVLLGDAGSALLPTAGVGASMAMESAAVLADELSRADARTIPHALALFEKRRHGRVDKVQADSRTLAKMMFIESTPLSFGRDVLMKFYSQEQFVKSFVKIYDEPI
ncbi:MAG: NAD(P)/FAD-dependent oxidoreductase [Pirellulaceae bacterium]